MNATTLKFARRCGHAVAIMALLAAILSAGPAQATAPQLFGSMETANTNLAPFKKWTGMLELYFQEVQQDFDRKKSSPGSCRSSTFNRCHYEKWEKFIAEQTGRDLMDQLKAVNRYMNSAAYIVDPKNWGVPDYWATPEQFFQRNGDCEDYAISKYLTLKRLGVPVAKMRLVVLQDLNLGIPHAILAVYHEDRIMILDNQIGDVVEQGTIRHYHPIFSINEEGWWLHRNKPRTSDNSRNPLAG
jgi:predicted transglutaminase-like cysteine proteinase